MLTSSSFREGGNPATLNVDRGRRAFALAIGASIASLLAGRFAAADALAGHRLTDAECAALAGHTLDASPRLRDDVARLLGDRFPRFLEGLADGRTIERLGDDLVGEGVRPGTLGGEGSFFVVGRDGALFAALKSGRYGEIVEPFGAVARLGPMAFHRWQEFADLDE